MLSTGASLLSVLIHSGETQVNKAFGALKGFVLHAESEWGLPELSARLAVRTPRLC